MSSVEKLHLMLKNKKYENDIYVKIFHILHTNGGVSYTNNSNGIFFILNDTHDGVAHSVLEYLEQINLSNKNHLINLHAREQTQEIYKKLISNGNHPETTFGTLKTESEFSNRSDEEDEGPGAPDVLVEKKKYKGVYKRLDDIMRNMRKNSNYTCRVSAEESKIVNVENSDCEEDLQVSDSDDSIVDVDQEEPEETVDDEELFGCYTDEED